MIWRSERHRFKKFAKEQPTESSSPSSPPSSIFPQSIQKFMPSKEVMTFVLLTVLSVFTLFRYVDLNPHVDQDFFFSNDDPHYQADVQISKLFVRKDTQILLSVVGNIFSKDYEKRIAQMSDLLSGVEGINGVKSITHGPKGVLDAIKSPFWSRLLIPENKKASNIFLIINGKASAEMINKVENITGLFNAEDFVIKISGPPYINELIRRHLQTDLRTFSCLAFLLFGLVVIFIFHSWRVFFGMVTCCSNAAAITFMLTHLLNIKIGILTANLSTIIFIITISHIIFLTYNWKNIYQSESLPSSVNQAVKITVWASFWCMITALLGFLSLLFVPAQPVKELGVAGSWGTVISFVVVYSVYPSFLKLKNALPIKSAAFLQNFFNNVYAFLHKARVVIILSITVLLVVTIPKLWDLNTDPDMLTYFKEGSQIREGLEYIDRNGGGSPLVMVINSQSGEKLNTKKSYRELWTLHQDLEKQKDVGTLLSLPALMTEGKRHVPALFLNWERYLKALEQPKFSRISDSFVTRDRRNGLFLFRMKELGRTEPRENVIAELKEIIENHHFVPALVGGIYALQGRLSELVAESLIYSLTQLIGIFALIALIFGRSFRISMAMTLSIAAIPLTTLGVIGYFRIPLDTISAPAVNIALGLGIDAMIHMVNIFHQSKQNDRTNAEHWAYVTKRMAEPILTSMFIICAGFGIFFFSSFPATQRFGGSIVFGSAVAAFTSLFIFPLLAKRRDLRKRAIKKMPKIEQRFE